jgi:HSP20 family protein
MAQERTEERTRSRERRPVRPIGDCIRAKDHVLLKLDMPGVTREHLDIDVEDNELRIIGRRTAAEIDGTYLLRERAQGNYQTVYTLDDTIDVSKIDARLDNGVLTVTLNLKEAVKPRKIEVKAG